jgi:hypothetical protein
MSTYNSRNFKVSRGNANCDGIPSAPVIHTYYTTDVFADVSAANYFPANFNFDIGEVIDNDLIFLQTFDQTGFFIVSDAETSPVLSANLLTQDVVTKTFGVEVMDFTGPWVGTESAAIEWTKQGDIVTLKFPDLSAAYNSTTIISTADTLPESLRPGSVNSIFQIMMVQNNSNTDFGYIIIADDGTFTVSRQGGGFTAGNVGFLKTAVTYSVQGE